MTGTGEEWKAMDEASRPYDPAAQDQIVARAKRDIERLRKRDVALRVVDRLGKPVANARLSAVQVKSDFLVGDQTWDLETMFRFKEHELDRAQTLMRRHAEVFNAANALCYWTERPRNDGSKSEDMQGEQRLEGFAQTVDWALSQGLTVKGHPLFWSIPKAVPEWVKRYDYPTQLKFLECRIRSIVARFKGRVAIWDAINEPMWEPAFKNLASRDWPHLDPIAEIADYIEPVLRWAREEDPDARYVINDYGLELDPPTGAPKHKDGSLVTAKRQRLRFLELMRELQNRGAAPDALGLQSHTGGWMPHADQIALYDEMATSGLPVHITEFWADTKHLDPAKIPQPVIDELQAEYVANYLTCAFAHPAVETFFFWGFNALRWIGTRSGHELTPVYHRVRRLLREEWLTTAELTTDSEGNARFRGFTGEYRLRHPTPLGLRGVAFQVSKQAGMPLTIVV